MFISWSATEFTGFGTAYLKRFATILGCLLSLPAFAGLSVPGALSYDNKFYTEYRGGDAPVVGGACPTGWTCAAKGDGTQDIDEISATSFLMVVSGKDNESNFGYAYKTTAVDDDIEVIMRVPATWTGHLETNTQFGVGLTEGTANDEYVALCFWRYDGLARFKSDAGGPAELLQSGLANQSLPRYVGISYVDADTTISCWESIDGFAWTQVGTHVTKSLTFPVLGFVYGTPNESGVTTTATPTAIAHSNTLTIEEDGGGDPDPPPNVAPVWNSTPIITGTAGTAKSITIANSVLTDDCTKRVCDDNGDALLLSERGCTWPTGVTVNNTTDTVEIATNAVAGTTVSCQIGADDGTAARVDSSAFSIVIAPAGGGEEDATIVWTGLLEGGAADISGTGSADFKTKTIGGGLQSVVTVADGVCGNPRQGSYMAKLEIPAGTTGNPQRAELKSNPSVTFYPDETSYWVGFSFCLETGNTGSVNTLFQIHVSFREPAGVPCEHNGNAVGIHSLGNLNIIDNPTGIDENSGANSNQVTVYPFTPQTGVWQDFVFNVRLSKVGNGTFTAWHQGEQVYSATNLHNTTWKNSCGDVLVTPYDLYNGLHVGLYQGNNVRRVMYYDAMRVAIGENGYNTVDPAQDD